MEEPLHFRCYSNTDNDGVSRLITDIFHVEAAERYCHWKYTENPAGTAKSSVALHQGRIIGQIGIIPYRFCVNGKEITGAQEVDFAIEEKFRTLDVLYRLSKLRTQIYEGQHFNFCYGFTTPNTSAIARKAVNFITVGAIPRMVKPLDARAFLRKIRFPSSLSAMINFAYRAKSDVKEEILEGAHLHTMRRFDERFDLFWNRIKNDYPIMTVKDSSYLNWRYIQHPDAEYQVLCLEKKATGEILGFIVLGIKYRHLPTGYIVDLVTPRNSNGKVARALLTRAILEFRRQKMAMVVCWMFSHAHNFGELTQLGFRYRQETGRDLIIHVLNPERSFLLLDLLNKAESWYISIGDSDFS